MWFLLWRRDIHSFYHTVRMKGMHVKGLTNGLGVGEGLLEEATAGKPTKICRISAGGAEEGKGGAGMAGDGCLELEHSS